MKKNYFTYFILLMSCVFAYAQPTGEDGVEFNGIDEDILVPNSSNINTTVVSNRTYEMYFKVDNGVSRQVLFEEGGGTNAVNIYIENNFVYAGIYKDNGGTGNSIFFRKPITNNVWYHMALVLDNASELKFYIDGILQDTRTGAFAIPSHSGGINMARSSSNLRYSNCTSWTNGGTSEYCLDNVTGSSANANYFAGHIWGFRVWNDVRTDMEIADNKDVLITDTNTNTDLLMVLNPNNVSIDYLDSSGNYQNVMGNFSTLSTNQESIDKVVIYKKDGVLYINTKENVEYKSIRIYSILGKEIKNLPFSNRLDISTLNNGVYFVMIEGVNQTITKKIML